MTRAEQWKREWRQEGRQEGLHTGRREGEAGLLLRQLERRFGPLPASITDRVGAANIAMLEDWGIRILDAVTLDDVFGERPV